jgi:hypothetical protein
MANPQDRGSGQHAGEQQLGTPSGGRWKSLQDEAGAKFDEAARLSREGKHQQAALCYSTGCQALMRYLYERARFERYTRRLILQEADLENAVAYTMYRIWDRHQRGLADEGGHVVNLAEQILFVGNPERQILPELTRIAMKAWNQQARLESLDAPASASGGSGNPQSIGEMIADVWQVQPEASADCADVIRRWDQALLDASTVGNYAGHEKKRLILKVLRLYLRRQINFANGSGGATATILTKLIDDLGPQPAEVEQREPLLDEAARAICIHRLLARVSLRGNEAHLFRERTNAKQFVLDPDASVFLLQMTGESKQNNVRVQLDRVIEWVLGDIAERLESDVFGIQEKVAALRNRQSKEDTSTDQGSEEGDQR